MDTSGLRGDIAAAAKGIATLGGKREIHELVTYLYEHELVELMATGTYSGSQGLVVLTNERLLFLVHGRSKQTHEEFPLPRVTAVEWRPGMLSGEITVAAGEARAEIKGVLKADGVKLVEAARSAVGAYAGMLSTDSATPPVYAAPFVVPPPPPYAPQAVPAAQAAPGADPRATLQSLRDWHAEGLITDEEYAAKRAEVLARL
ncbi:PH domain-containing protein [Phytomonospora sp. NPDC050363]|uniref:PH domain-containing protein n=1 Tax=Phytomonospora sp. NPDC050363 TaxID=3155642 RepID=UPI0034019319